MFYEVRGFNLALRGRNLGALRFVLTSSTIKRIAQDLLLGFGLRSCQNELIGVASGFLQALLGRLEAASRLYLLLMSKLSLAVAHDDLRDDLGVPKWDIVKGALRIIELRLLSGSIVVVLASFRGDGPRRDDHRRPLGVVLLSLLEITAALLLLKRWTHDVMILQLHVLTNRALYELFDCGTGLVHGWVLLVRIQQLNRATRHH